MEVEDWKIILMIKIEEQTIVKLTSLDLYELTCLNLYVGIGEHILVHCIVSPSFLQGVQV